LKPEEKKGKFTVYETGPAFGTNFLVFNQNLEKDEKTDKNYVELKKQNWFTNKKFRQAAAHSIDKAGIVDIVMNGMASPQDSAMSPSAGFFYNPNVQKYEYNLEKARTLLKEAGFVEQDTKYDRSVLPLVISIFVFAVGLFIFLRKSNSKWKVLFVLVLFSVAVGFFAIFMGSKDQSKIIKDAEGNDVEFNLFTNSGNTQRVQIANIIRKDLERLGFKVHFMQLEFNNLVTKLDSTYDWDAVILGLTGGIEPHFGNNVWQSSGHLHMWYPKQKEPATLWEKQIDDIFDRGVQELDRQKRKELYDQWQGIVAEELPFIYTVLPTNLFAVRNKFGNLYPTSYGGAFHNLEEIFIK
jgi:peptide/nickel transport system substrate-binding protein